jgi:hypothetical protein
MAVSLPGDLGGLGALPYRLALDHEPNRAVRCIKLAAVVSSPVRGPAVGLCGG